ncbi:MAG: metallophosphoesterase, partial [Geobacteraceae bacterium]|nr:metallophosphoesterase [Geobacteraceae bacterium]
MLVFLALFLSIYTAMHALVFWGMHPLLKGHRALPTLTWVWMALMLAVPLLVRALEKGGYDLAARALAWVGFSWMGFLFLAFSVFALVGVWHVLSLGLSHLGAPNLSVRGPVCSLLVALMVLGVGIYGMYEATDLRVERVTLQSDKLPEGIERVRIAHISDLHLGLIHREEALAPVISRILELQPDILIASGDIVDAQIDHIESLSALWQRVNPPLGKYAVMGNHEFYAGKEQALRFLHSSGFTVVRNRGIDVDGILRVVGIDDPARDKAGQQQRELEVLQQNHGEMFTLLIKHRPSFTPQSAALFDLQLSGHAHRGQIIPFNVLTALEYPHQDGLYPLPSGAHLYTSRGTGTWGPPMRVLSPPEIALIEVVAVQ